MSSYLFIAHDPHEALAVRWASWIAAHLPAGSPEAVLPLKEWALGAWESYLESRIAGASRCLVVLSQGFLRAEDAFVRFQRQALLGPQSPSAQVRPLLVALAQEWPDLCGLCGGEEQLRQVAPTLFSDRVTWVDLTPIAGAERAVEQILLDRLAA
jgi:hypothetical protein